MAKQPEQILEEQLIEQLQKLNYSLVPINDKNSCKSKNIIKMFTEFKNSITFAPTVLVQHTLRFARGSFFLKKYNNNTPSMPLRDAHLEGFFV